MSSGGRRTWATSARPAARPGSPGPVLSLASAAGALRAGRRASAPTSGAGGPARAAGAGDRTPAAERGGERGDVGRQPDRGVPAAPLAGTRGPQYRAAGVAPRGAGDP